MEGACASAGTAHDAAFNGDSSMDSIADWADIFAPLDSEDGQAIRQWLEGVKRPATQSSDDIQQHADDLGDALCAGDYILPPLYDDPSEQVAEEPRKRKADEGGQHPLAKRAATQPARGGLERQVAPDREVEVEEDEEDDDEVNETDDLDGGSSINDLAFSVPPPSPSSISSSLVRWYSRTGRYKGDTQGFESAPRGLYGVAGDYAVIRIHQKAGDGQLKQTRMFLRRSRPITESVLSHSASIVTRLCRLRREINALQAIDPEIVASSVTHLDSLLKLWGAQRSAARINLRMMKIV
jgi:hypothetical protein